MNEEDEATWPTHEEIFAQELSDEAAFAIYQLLQTFTQHFKEHYYGHIRRHLEEERSQEQVENSSENGILWDDELPF